MINLIQRIKKFMHLHQTIEEVVRFYIERTEKKVDKLQLYHMKQTALKSTERGITNEKIADHDVIVSLTTHSKRIYEVFLAIESIMQGTIKPNRIILWLAEGEYDANDLPIFLRKQMKRGLEIRYCKDLRSYKKIIPALKLFPDACIVTIDDDLLYEPDILEHLLLSYRKYPTCVSACRTERIKTDDNGIPLEYNKWDLLSHTQEPSHYNFLTSGGGTLFPPHILPLETQNEKIFMKLAPETDDVWLNAMLLLGKVKVVKAFTHNPNGSDYVANESPYVKTLWSENKLGRNDMQLQSVWNHYGLTLYD